MASVSWPSAVAAPDGTTIGFNSAGLLTVLQAPKLVLPSGISVAQDPSGYLGIFNGSGAQVETVDGAGHHVFANTSGSTSYSNFEIITNGTETTLTGNANYIGNAGGNPLLYGKSITLTSTQGPLNLNSGVHTSGKPSHGSSTVAGPITIANVGAVTASSAFSAVNLSASYSTTSTTPVSTGLGTAKIVVSSATEIGRAHV